MINFLTGLHSAGNLILEPALDLIAGGGLLALAREWRANTRRLSLPDNPSHPLNGRERYEKYHMPQVRAS